MRPTGLHPHCRLPGTEGHKSPPLVRLEGSSQPCLLCLLEKIRHKADVIFPKSVVGQCKLQRRFEAKSTVLARKASSPIITILPPQISLLGIYSFTDEPCPELYFLLPDLIFFY